MVGQRIAARPAVGDRRGSLERQRRAPPGAAGGRRRRAGRDRLRFRGLHRPRAGRGARAPGDPEPRDPVDRGPPARGPRGPGDRDPRARRSNVVKTALLRSVSHDLRSPLTAITAAAGGLGSPTLDEQARAELVSVIATESDRLTRLVDNLLDLSRLQAGQLDPHADWTSAEELIEAVVAAVPEPAAWLELAVEPDLRPVRGRLGSARTRARQLGRELRPLRRRRAGHDRGPAGRLRPCDPGHGPRSRGSSRRSRTDLRTLPRLQRRRRNRARPGDRPRLR